MIPADQNVAVAIQFRGDAEAGRRTADQPPQAPTGQPVGRESPRLEGPQAIEVGTTSVSDFNARHTGLATR